MSMRGNCRCNNIEVVWHTVDYSVVPRACQCKYCLAKGAVYVSKSGTAVDIRVHKERLHRIITHGSRHAWFHECGNCGDMVLVTAELDGVIYGALNANCMRNVVGFSSSVPMDLSAQTAKQKRDRWQQNWCHPVTMKGQGGEMKEATLPDIPIPGESA